eukprot:gene4669-4922_t
MDEQGYVEAPVLLQHMRSKPSWEELQEVVASCKKQRFVLDELSDPPRVRAAQGHSVVLAAPVLQPITDASSIPCAIHATSKDSWDAIQASGELRRMQRTHIHFATQPDLLRNNRWAAVKLKLKLAEALAAGRQFFLSTNNVLLTEGPLPVEFVEEMEGSGIDTLVWGSNPS